MTYQDALPLVKHEFETMRENSRYVIIRTGLTYDGCQGFCVALYDLDKKAIITDFGATKDAFDEVEDETWQALCEERGFRFSQWRIERDFHSPDDVHTFIQFLDELSDRFFTLGDDD